METKKVLGLIFSLLFISAFAFVLTWGIINFNKVKDGMSGTGLYTQEDLNCAYEDGYDTALQDKDEYDQLINSYRDTITTQTDQISQLNSQVLTLTNSNKDYAKQITNLESQKSNLQIQVNNLTTIKSNNETTIASLQSQVTTLQNEVEVLTNSCEDKDEMIVQKNIQISNLQTVISQLQDTNELNTQTIISLNNQINILSSQISDMFTQIQNNSAIVTSLNNKISQLERSIAYYEQYVANLENETQVVVTFEFNGSVYNIQIVDKNSTVSVVEPTSTDYVVFNYWAVNGEEIDLSTYQFATNTKVVADVTYKYDVKFMVDDCVYNSQIIAKNGYAILPDNPIKSSYEFDGWTINGIDIVDVDTMSITSNITFIAKFSKIYDVLFTSKTWNGFSEINGSYVWTDGENTYYSYGSTQYVLDVETSTWLEKTWNGLSSLNGLRIWTDGINYYYSNGTVQYVLDIATSTWFEKTWTGLTNFNGTDVWTDGENIYYSSRSTQYVLDVETSTWSEKVWNGFSSVFGSTIWTDGINYYYSYGSTHYVLDVETSTWSEKAWNNSIDITYSIFYYQDNIYSLYKGSLYMLNINTSTWVEKTIDLTIFSNDISEIGGSRVWTDGVNCYFSLDSDQFILEF